MMIQEGELDLAEVRTRLVEDQRNFDILFVKKIESLFQENPQLLLTESQGKKLGLIIGENELLGGPKRKKPINLLLF